MTYTFDLLGGTHIEKQDGVVKRFSRGDRFTSNTELDKLLGSEKFRRISESASPPPSSHDPEEEGEDEDGVEDVSLESMSLTELREYAAQENIDIGGAKRKSDIIQIISDSIA